MAATAVRHEDPTWLALQSAHQLGVLARISRKVVRCHTLPDVMSLMQGATGQLGFSGWFRLSIAERSLSQPLGEGLASCHYPELLALGNCSEKVSCCDSVAVFKTYYLLLVIDTINMPAEQIDMFKDNMMVLVDTLDFWLEQYARLSASREQTLMARLDVSDRMNDVISAMLRFSRHLTENHRDLCQELLTNLLVSLPTLGLESDQEDNMIDMVTIANNEHGRLIDLQLVHNEEMRKIMAEAIAVLMQDDEPPIHTTHEDDDDGLDESIILF